VAPAAPAFDHRQHILPRHRILGEFVCLADPAEERPLVLVADRVLKRPTTSPRKGALGYFCRANRLEGRRLYSTLEMRGKNLHQQSQGEDGPEDCRKQLTPVMSKRFRFVAHHCIQFHSAESR
jgi:hypothetical protein